MAATTGGGCCHTLTKSPRSGVELQERSDEANGVGSASPPAVVDMQHRETDMLSRW